VRRSFCKIEVRGGNPLSIITEGNEGVGMIYVAKIAAMGKFSKVSYYWNNNI
jgi:hypothetical protein